ncbi:precorrin-6Y C5,15-methyltransferase (decarboxylating) [Paraburkholderia sp. BL27I4N3]|uniref:precorrin-6y C5,15-methyltransferase (decarboxylating) subunit CbiE n=1 Tax=Paraburkholderia sp. BL27I4N3 TaxID=1938805 RepID=UPI000E239F59|nr:precorrin-6y C5,15-methyltransferase (decarboxylating) subunit CbiE [Paraburkholderia sp. BL27I4N3]REE21900.1 precorrin-6Y C5,15-methyltransferase (decarboxylating) [Paraburkholderia sp. BL27I4N3]
MPAWLTVVGIGDDGFAGLGRPARRALLEASVVYGGERHLAMLPACLAARRAAWPRPFDLAPLLAERGAAVCVLASGDPMLFGVGATLARQLPAGELRVLPAPSSLSLAAARLGWPLQDVATVSLVGRPLPTLNAHLHDGARMFVLSANGRTPAALAALLNARGYGATRMSVLEHLGGELERRIDGRADQWSAGEVAALNLIALDCRATEGAPRLPLTCGLPDDAFRHDGQLTKRDVRAITLARLAPTPGELLWDVGAGSGSIGIEWMRVHSTCRAIAIEGHAERQRFIEHNRDALGVPGLQLVAGRAPEALQGLPVPDAVFIGGGVTVPGVLEACWAGLREGGRLVANAVTLQGEAVLAAWRERHGGTLTRIALADAQPLGGFDTWRQALPITLLEVTKPASGEGVNLVGTETVINAANAADAANVPNARRAASAGSGMSATNVANSTKATNTAGATPTDPSPEP